MLEKPWASEGMVWGKSLWGVLWSLWSMALACNTPRVLWFPQPYPVTTEKVAKTLKKGRSQDWKGLYRSYKLWQLSGSLVGKRLLPVLLLFTASVAWLQNAPVTGGGLASADEFAQRNHYHMHWKRSGKEVVHHKILQLPLSLCRWQQLLSPNDRSVSVIMSMYSNTPKEIKRLTHQKGKSKSVRNRWRAMPSCEVWKVCKYEDVARILISHPYRNIAVCVRSTGSGLISGDFPWKPGEHSVGKRMVSQMGFVLFKYRWGRNMA